MGCCLIKVPLLINYTCHLQGMRRAHELLVHMWMCLHSLQAKIIFLCKKANIEDNVQVRESSLMTCSINLQEGWEVLSGAPNKEDMLIFGAMKGVLSCS